MNVFCFTLQLSSLNLPDHWMKQFFLGHTYLEQQRNEDALDIYFALQQNGFDKSTYLIAQAAIAFHNRRGKYCFTIYFG